MSKVISQSSATQSPGEDQPQAILAPAPYLLIGLFSVIAFLGILYVDSFGGQMQFRDDVYAPYPNYAAVDAEQFKDPKQMRLIHGGKLFAANCSPCHQNSGLGLPGQFPPLVASEWVNAKSPARIIRAVLCGLQGSLKVKDQVYNNVMVPWRDTLKDDDIADVLLFIRQNKEWGNNASDVTPEEVAKIRAETKDHTTAYTEPELLKIPVD